jgi:flagellar protein FlaG
LFCSFYISTFSFVTKYYYLKISDKADIRNKDGIQGEIEMKITNLLPLKEASVHQASRDDPALLEKILEQQIERNEEIRVSKKKVEEVTNKLNEFLEIQNRSLKFILHDELDQYYVQVINSDTKEVIREIPPKKLLDAFYTMQKFLGMIVDEKI